MKRLTLLLLLLSAALCARAAEDNNPCLHEWGDTQYDCNTGISEKNPHASLPCSSATLSAVKSAAEGATETGGVCKSYQVCGKCSARKDLDSDYLGNKTASYNGTPVYDENSSPRVLRTGWHGLTVSASCHTTRSCNVGIYVEGHQHELATARTDRDIKPCYMTGRVPHESPSQVYIGVPAPSIPVGSTHCFNVNWNNPDPNGVTNGIEYFNKYKCANCSVIWTFAENARPSATHQVEHPIPTSDGGEYVPYAAYNYLFSFPEVGDGLKVTFLKQCKEHKVDIYGWNPQQISLFPCEEGKFEYSVNAVGVDSLDYSPKDKKVYFKEVGEEDPRQKTLYVLSEIKPEDVVEGGNDARGPTAITFTAAATGTSGFPSVHPILGGFTDDELSFGEKILRDLYLFPLWTSSHSGCNIGTCRPDHHEFTGVSGSTTGTFTGKTTGVYTVSSTCGTENEPADPNDNYGTRTRFVHVCNPVAIADFQVARNSENQKVIGDLTPCDARPIPIVFGGDMNHIPEGEKATLTIKADADTYELYKDPEGMIEASAADLELEVTASEFRKTVYLLPLQPDPDKLRTDYEITTRYGIAGSKVKADDKQDYLVINWRPAGCSGGACKIPRVTSKNSSVLVQASFGEGAWGVSGGTLQVYSPVMTYRLLDRKQFISGTDENGEDIVLDPVLRFAYGNGSTVKIATAEDEAANSSMVEGYPVRIRTGQYCTELSYRKATVGGFTFIDKMTATQYLSTETDASVPMSGGSTPVSVIVTEIMHDNVIPAGAEEPVANSFNVSHTESAGAVQTTRTWQFTDPVLTCPDLTGDYTISQLSENGVNNILVKQNYTQDGLEHRREIRYIGSMTAPAFKEDKTYCTFAWGEELVSETVGGATTVYEFYTEGNGKSKQKKVTYPQGNSITSVYNEAHELLSQTEVRGGQTFVTTYTYSYNETEKKRTVVTEVRAGTTLTSKSKSVVYEVKPNTNPDESIRYDENDNEYVTKTWYTQGPNGIYDRRVARQDNPDGTRTVYTYNRSGDTDTTTTLSGVFSGDPLPLGTRQVSVSNGSGTTVSSESWFVDTANNVDVKTASTVNSNFDAFGRAQTTTYLDGSTVNRVYGCCGVESETDRDGIVTTYAYDDFKRLSYSVRDGITTLYSYDAAGNQTSVTVKGRNNTEITTSTEYVNGEVSATVDALNNRTTYARQYAISGEVTTYTETVTNPDNSTRVTTSVNGAQTSVGGTAVHPQSYEYGANWQRTLPQNVTAYSDLLGRQYRTVYADNSEAEQYYNSKSQVVKSVTPAGRVTLYEYDTLGRQTAQAIDMNANDTIDAADIVTTTAYGYATYGGKTVSVTTATRSQGADSKVISVNRQSLDGLESWSTDMAGLTTHTLRERLGSGATRQTVTQPTGVKTVTVTQNGRISTVTTLAADDTVHSEVNYTYDEFNRVSATEEKDADNNTINTTAMTYNAAGQILTQTVNGQTTSYAYDVANRTVTTTQPGNRVVVQESYPTGELKRISGADTYTQEWTWNPTWGQKATLTTWKDANTPQVTSWTYNNRGFNTAKAYADNNGPTYTYDADGNMLTRTWARGITTTYTYDAAGRQTSQSYSDGTPSVTNNYDYLSRIPTLTDAAGTWNFTYNTAGKLASTTNPVILNSVVNYTYDTYARPTVMELTRGGTTQTQATYGYDSLGRIATLGNGSDTLSYAYRPGMNQLLTAQWRDSQNVALNGRSYEYDTRHRLTEIKLDGVREVAYTLNDKDQRTAAEYANSGAWNFTYDGKSQVTGAAGNNTNFAYNYDEIGNRTTATEGATNWTYASNLLNQYTQVNALLPTHDADGNMLTWNGWTYTWNGENRLVCAESGDTKVEMNYDYTGRRFEKKVYTKGLLNLYTWTLQKHEKYVYNGYKQIASYDALNSEALLKTYTWQSVDLDVPVSMTSDGETYYYVTDGNKNVTALLDASGNRVAEYTYGPFGQTLEADGSMAEENPFRFSSEFHDDELGLVYYNYRHYNQTLGRWAARDPNEEKSGINLYSFIGNSSINNIDFLGLASFWDIIQKALRDKRDFDHYTLLGILRSQVFQDDEGYLIFERWALGKGDWLNAPFGDYLKAHKGLNAKLREELYWEFKKLADKPIGYVYEVDNTIEAGLDNGYATGYQLLHITNRTVGGFNYKGIIIKRGTQCYDGDITYTWNDKIDPNYKYDLDFLFNIFARPSFDFRPRNYTISIIFKGVFHAEVTSDSGGYYNFTGYPRDNALID